MTIACSRPLALDWPSMPAVDRDRDTDLDHPSSKSAEFRLPQRS